MKERPILMSAPMVRAILKGRKTQTRRVADTGFYAIDESVHGLATAIREREKLLSRCPNGVPGDRLWVRETLCSHRSFGLPLGKRPQKNELGERIWSYAADGVDADSISRRTPSIFMPRWASRLALEVTGVRVERVRDISEEDAKAEGIVEPARGFPFGPGPRAYAGLYSDLWDSLNAARGFGWDKNPWVWVLEFRRI